MPPSAKARKRDYKKAARIAKAVRESKDVAPDDLTWYRDVYLPSRKPFGGAQAAAGTDVAPEGTEPEFTDAGDETNDEHDDLGDDESPAAADPGNPGTDSSGNVEPAAPPVAGTDSSGNVEPAAPPVAVASGEPSAPPIPPPPPPPRGPRFAPPKPPRTKVDDDAKGKAGREKWQDKYKGKQQGRESTVTFCATQICNVLALMSAEMKAVGVEPMVDVGTLFNPWVLTLDELLPSNLEMKPEHMAVGGTSILVVQRFMVRKKIAAANGKTSEQADVAKRKAEVERKQQEQQKERDERAKGFDPHLRGSAVGGGDTAETVVGAVPSVVPTAAPIPVVVDATEGAPGVPPVVAETPPPAPESLNRAEWGKRATALMADPTVVI